MPFEFNVSSDIDKLREQFKGQEEALDFGLHQGLRNTVVNCRRETRKEIERVFDRPRATTLNAVRFESPSLDEIRGNNREFRARVFLYDWAAQYLLLYDEPSTLTELYNFGFIVYPVNLRLDGHGNVRDLQEQQQYSTLLEMAQNGEDDLFLVMHPTNNHLPSGVYIRENDEHVRMLFGIDDSRPIKKLWDFDGFVTECYNREFFKNYNAAVEEYIRKFVIPLDNRS